MGETAGFFTNAGGCCNQGTGIKERIPSCRPSGAFVPERRCGFRNPSIRFRIADVLPTPLVDHGGGDRSGRLPDHLHEGGNDRFDLPRGQTPEEPFLHHVDPREEAAPDAGIPEEAAEIADFAPRVEADVSQRAVAPEGEGDFTPPCRMGGRQP